MPMNRRTGVLTLTASLILAAGAAVVVPANAVEQRGPVGQLELTTSGSAGAVAYNGSTQTLAGSSANNCPLSSTGPNLLSVSGLLNDAPTATGLKDGSIGVVETDNTSFCNRVDDVTPASKSETLVLALGTDLNFFGQGGLTASKASLDIQVRSTRVFFRTNKAKIEATALRGTTTVQTFTLEQGVNCNVSDDGNCQWVIDPDGNAEFDTLRLKALKGSFSLEGGSDADSLGLPTTFDLVGEVQEIFECQAGNSIGESDSGKVTYVGSANPEDCVDFGAQLNVGENSVQFLKPLDVDTTAQFEVDVQWTTPGVATGAAILPTVVIDYETGAVNATTLKFCPAFVTKEVDAEYSGITNENLPQLTTAFDQEPELGGIQFACITTRSADVTELEVVTTDKIFLIGDARINLR